METPRSTSFAAVTPAASDEYVADSGAAAGAGGAAVASSTAKSTPGSFIDLLAEGSPEPPGEDSIRVVCRIRPVNRRERAARAAIALKADEDAGTISTSGVGVSERTYAFDHVLGPEVSQESVFRTVGKPISTACLSGYNGAIFAYGQTGSGKTHTILGPDAAVEGTAEDLRGLLPRVLDFVFSQITRAERVRGRSIRYVCNCSFLEIYNEKIYDLLDASSPSLQLREHLKKGVYVDGLTEESVTSAEQALAVMRTGARNRKVASTAMNRESSRSHSVFSLVLEATEEVDGITRSRSSHFHLVDLAGSERQRDTRASGERLKEAGNINKSLSALGNVINALVDISKGRQRHVPYRDSKLTFLLKDSLGGNSRTFIVAALSPADDCLGESLSTLNFARRAKMVKTNAVLNEDVQGSVSRLTAEIATLKRQLHEAQSLASSGCFGVGSITSGIIGAGFSTPAGQNARLGTPASAFVGASTEEEEKRVSKLHNTLQDALWRADLADSRLGRSKKDAENLKQIIKSQQNTLQSLKLVVKLRDAHIERLRHGGDPLPPSEKEQALLEEIAALKEQVDHPVEAIHWRKVAEDLQATLDASELGTIGMTESKDGELTRLQGLCSGLSEEIQRLVADKARWISKVDAAGSTPAFPRPGSTETPRLSSARRALMPFRRRGCGPCTCQPAEFGEPIPELNPLADLLRAQLEEARSGRQEAEARLTEASNANASLQAELDATLLRLETTEFSRAKLESEAAASQAKSDSEAQQAYKRLEQETSSRILDLETRYAAACREARAMEGRLREVENFKAELVSEKASLTAANTKLEQTSAEASRENEQLSERLRELAETLDAAYDENRLVRSDRDKQMVLVGELSCRISRLETDVGRLQRESSTAQSEADDYRFQVSSLEESLDSMAAELEYSKSKQGSTQQQLDAVSSELELKNTECTELQQSLRSLQEDRDHQLKENAEENATLLSRSQARCEALEVEAINARRTAKGTAEKLALAESRNEELREKLRGCHSELKLASSTIHDLQTAVQEAQIKLREVTSSLESTRNEATCARAETERLTCSLKSTEQDLEELQRTSKQELDEKNAQLRKEKELTGTLRNALSDLKLSLSSLGRRLESSREEINRTTCNAEAERAIFLTRVRDLKAQLTVSQETEAKLEKELAECRQLAQRMHEAKLRMEVETKALEATVETLRQEAFMLEAVKTALDLSPRASSAPSSSSALSFLRPAISTTPTTTDRPVSVTTREAPLVSTLFASPRSPFTSPTRHSESAAVCEQIFSSPAGSSPPISIDSLKEAILAEIEDRDEQLVVARNTIETMNQQLVTLGQKFQKATKDSSARIHALLEELAESGKALEDSQSQLQHSRAEVQQLKQASASDGSKWEEQANKYDTLLKARDQQLEELRGSNQELTTRLTAATIEANSVAEEKRRLQADLRVLENKLGAENAETEGLPPSSSATETGHRKQTGWGDPIPGAYAGRACAVPGGASALIAFAPEFQISSPGAETENAPYDPLFAPRQLAWSAVPQEKRSSRPNVRRALLGQPTAEHDLGRNVDGSGSGL